MIRAMHRVYFIGKRSRQELVDSLGVEEILDRLIKANRMHMF